jgi:hypothetical protein
MAQSTLVYEINFRIQHKKIELIIPRSQHAHHENSALFKSYKAASRSALYQESTKPSPTQDKTDLLLATEQAFKESVHKC